MDWGTIIGAGISFLGSALSSSNSKKQNSAIMAQNKADTKELMKLQQKYDTEYQKAQNNANYSNASKLLGVQTKTARELMQLERDYNLQYMSESAKSTLATNQKLMDYQYNLERDSRQNSYSDTRVDLEKAGYNPLLAVGQQSNYTPVSSGVSTDSAGVEQANVGATRAGIMSSVMNTINQTSATRSQNTRNAVLNKVDRENAITSAQKIGAEIGQINSATRGQEIRNHVEDMTALKRANAEINQIVEATNLNKAQATKIVEEINTNRVLRGLYNSEIEQTRAQTGMINEQRSIANSANVGVKEYGKWQKQHPKIAGTLSAIKGISLPPIVFSNKQQYYGGDK